MTDLRDTPTKALIAELTSRYPHLADVLRLPLDEPPLTFQTEAHWDHWMGKLEYADETIWKLYRQAEEEFPRVADLVGGPF